MGKHKKEHKEHKHKHRERGGSQDNEEHLPVLVPKLIVKLGSSPVGEEVADSPAAPVLEQLGGFQGEEYHQGSTSNHHHHRHKDKKKKKKKDKKKSHEKDRDHREHRHHHKSKKRKRDQSEPGIPVWVTHHHHPAFLLSTLEGERPPAHSQECLLVLNL